VIDFHKKLGRKIFMRILYSFVILCSFTHCYGIYGKSYLSIRPHFEAGSTERIVIDHLFQINPLEKKHSFQIVPLGGQTTKAENLAKYFLPSDNQYITIAEDNASCQRDINANYLGIVSVPVVGATNAEIQNLITSMTYQSRLTLCPKRKGIGAGFIYRYQLPKNWWFDISTAIIHLQHNLNTCEYIVNNGGPGPNGFGYKSLNCSMAANNYFCYAKLSSCIQKKTGVPQVELRIGNTGYHEEHNLTGFIGVDIPTGNKPRQKYVFEPVVGNNKHAGIFFAIQGKHNLSKTETHTISLSSDFLLRYLFHNTQLRSFDLKNKVWSRYMWVWRNNNAFNDPGSATNVETALNRINYLVNYSTLCARVSPKARFDGSISLNFDKENWHVETGYHLYASQKEEISLQSNICNNIGISALANYLQDWSVNNNSPSTRSFNTINGNTFAEQPDVIDYTYNATEETYNDTYKQITNCDLDLNSCATPGQFVHNIYASLGYQWQKKHPLLFNLGASYDISANNHAPDQWLIWAQFGITF